ncbi:uncharacterized protein ATC70_007545 [Mucor velutinosus]|uniref:F-box domain-containing protein n=1 Tax=Mucor velutinosus TaxID=708070 RepID=A0AAN7HPX3_9FUNG|nr:hypothetical protein ATC70_007545 [Mucor velutinosus]
MSAPTKSLPAELWLNIFDQLSDGKQLAQCRLVCRSWRPFVEKVMYKVVDLTGMHGTQVAELSEQLAMRPELGRLVQKICFCGDVKKKLSLYKILRSTPNLKIIDGKSWDESLVGEVLSKPECSALKLKQLPCINGFSIPSLKSLLCFKETLQSTAFKFTLFTSSNCHTLLGDSLHQFKHLQQLSIDDQFFFGSLRDLDRLLRNCNQIQDLRLFIQQHPEYNHIGKAELEQWLTNSIQRVGTVKSLEIDFQDDSLEDEESQPYGFGPDWMDYLAYKYPNVTRLTVCSDEYNRQHIILPKFTHLETFVLEKWRFYDLDVLKNFIDMLTTKSVYIECKVNYEIHHGDPYICLMSAIKKRQDDSTAFSFQLPCDDSIAENSISVMSLFSSRLIKKFDMNLSESEHLEPVCASMKCNLNVESCTITTEDMVLDEYPQQPIFTVLYRLEIVDTNFKHDFMTLLNMYAPYLRHLKLVNCTFVDEMLMPSIQLASLALHKNESGKDHLENKDYTSLLFRISTTKCPEQIFLALPRKPLQRVTREEAKLSKKPTIYIECGSLKHLSVNLADFKFEMEFDDDTNLIKSVDSGIEDSY